MSMELFLRVSIGYGFISECFKKFGMTHIYSNYIHTLLRIPTFYYKAAQIA